MDVSTTCSDAHGGEGYNKLQDVACQMLRVPATCLNVLKPLSPVAKGTKVCCFWLTRRKEASLGDGQARHPGSASHAAMNRLELCDESNRELDGFKGNQKQSMLRGARVLRIFLQSVEVAIVEFSLVAQILSSRWSIQ